MTIQNAFRTLAVMEFRVTIKNQESIDALRRAAELADELAGDLPWNNEVAELRRELTKVVEGLTGDG